MSELWAIAEDGRVLFSHHGASASGAWGSFYRWMDVRFVDFDKWVEQQKRRGYLAVRIRYEIVERDGEGK